MEKAKKKAKTKTNKFTKNFLKEDQCILIIVFQSNSRDFFRAQAFKVSNFSRH